MQHANVCMEDCGGVGQATRHPKGGQKPMSLNIRTWLEAGGFGQYADLFEANEIDGEALRALTGEHLKELGIPLSRRAKLLKAIAGLSPGSSPSPAAGPGRSPGVRTAGTRSEEHTSELQSRLHLVCRLLLEKKQ